MSSTRLPGKVLLDLGGRPVLERMIERVKRAKNVTETVVATTTDASDDAIVELCKKLDTPVFRGSLPDVLDRYYQCALEYKADYVVRLTGDCPLIDPELIDEVILWLIRPAGGFLLQPPAAAFWTDISNRVGCGSLHFPGSGKRLEKRHGKTPPRACDAVSL